MAVRREYVEDLYRNVLNRPEGSWTDAEVEGHLNNPGGEQGLYDFFTGSSEYKALHPEATQTWQDQGGQVVYDNPDDAPAYFDPGPSSTPQGGYDGGGGAPAGVSANAATGFSPTVADWTKLHGFNSQNYYDPGMQSVKYTFARIAADYPPTPEGLKSLVNDARFKSAFPNARLAGFDRIDFGGALSDGASGSPVGVIDVGEAFDPSRNTGNGWWWGYEPDNMHLTGQPGTSGTSGKSGSSLSGLTNLLGQLGSLGQQYAGPGGAGQTKGPLEQVGQDPLSQLISGGLVDFIGRGGTTPFGEQLGARLMEMIESGGNIDEGATRRRFESSRELIDKARRTMINDARGDLASRNLLSEPGIAQGVEAGTMGRITESLGAEFARAQRDIISDEADRADTRVQNALSMATGLAADQAKTFLAGLGEGTARQIGLAQVALQSLEQNQAWNMFLAEYGLKRDTVLAELQNGRVDDVMQLLNSFLSLASLSRGGYV
jgi:hypothetical protein